VMWPRFVDGLCSSRKDKEEEEEDDDDDDDVDDEDEEDCYRCISALYLLHAICSSQGCI